MIAALLMLAAQPEVPPVTAWHSLPVFPLPRVAPVADASAYVRAEVKVGRCAAAETAGDGTHLAAPVAILVGSSGVVRQVVPQAIGCATVEQYTVGYILSLIRAGSGAGAVPAPGWYQLTVHYRW